MRVRSMLKTISMLLFIVLFTTLSLSAQDFVVKNITVNDSPGTLSCDGYYHDWLIKGNQDGAISPGERVALSIEIENRSGLSVPYHASYQDSLYAIISENSPYLIVHSPDCRFYDESLPSHVCPTDCPPMPGSRYATPLDPGDTEINADPFILEVSQDIPCGQFVELSITIYYCFTPTGEGSPCDIRLTETHSFTLPVFSLDKAFMSTSESELFQSSYDHKMVASPTNSRDIGIFFSQTGSSLGTYYSTYNLDGTITAGPVMVHDSNLIYGYAAGIWNDRSSAYQLLVPNSNYLRVISASYTGGDPQDVSLNWVFPTVSSIYSVSSAYYDDETGPVERTVALVQADNYNSFLLQIDASDPFSLVQYADLVEPNTTSTHYYSSIGYLPGVIHETGTDGIGEENRLTDYSKSWENDQHDGRYLKDAMAMDYKINDTVHGPPSYLSVTGYPSSGSYEIYTPPCYYVAGIP